MEKRRNRKTNTLVQPKFYTQAILIESNLEVNSNHNLECGGMRTTHSDGKGDIGRCFWQDDTPDSVSSRIGCNGVKYVVLSSEYEVEAVVSEGRRFWNWKQRDSRSVKRLPFGKNLERLKTRGELT